MKYFVLLLLSFPAFAATLSLDSYLNQVTERHDDFKAAKKTFRATQLTANEAHLLLSPTVFSSVNHMDDARPSLLFHYNKQITDNYQLGISQQTSLGLSGRLYYSWLDTVYKGLVFSGPPTDLSGSQGSPTLELTLPLWRNWLGSETKAQIDQVESLTAAQKLGESYKMKSLLVQAESTYWNLALAREAVKVSRDAVERATQLYKWNTYRANSGLADKADLLQADANLQTRNLEFKNAEDDERSAARVFNATRGVDSSQVSETLAPLKSETLDKLQIPKRSEMRDDTRAALEQSKAAQAGAEAARQKYRPTLELFGSAALNNDNPTTQKNKAFGNSFDDNRPTKAIGLRFSTPLDLDLVHDVRTGHEEEKTAAQLTYQRKLFDQEVQWTDLSEKFYQAKDRLNIYNQLESAQREKLDYERIRRSRGRTTTQVVIQFETEFEQTQLARLKTMSEILQLLAQIKLYGTSNPVGL